MLNCISVWLKKIELGKWKIKEKIYSKNIAIKIVWKGDIVNSTVQ